MQGNVYRAAACAPGNPHPRGGVLKTAMASRPASVLLRLQGSDIVLDTILMDEQHRLSFWACRPLLCLDFIFLLMFVMLRGSALSYSKAAPSRNVKHQSCKIKDLETLVVDAPGLVGFESLSIFKCARDACVPCSLSALLTLI
eukprot:1159643-Pelagomonas_calceolata.AAC.2